MKKEPNGADMIGELFGKGQGLACKASQALAQRVVKALQITGLATAFVDDAMAVAGQHVYIGLPAIRVTKGTLPIDSRHFRPQGSGTLAATISRVSASMANQSQTLLRR